MSATDIPGLAFVQAPAAPETFNILLYGPPKSGKSTAAATAPGPILWVNAEGPGALGYARLTAAKRGTVIHEVQIGRRDDARVVLRAVLEHVVRGVDPKPATVVVDTLAKVRDSLVRLLVTRQKDSRTQYGEVNRILTEFISMLRDADVNLILLAHEDVKDEDGERIVQPLIGGALTQFAPGEVDVLGYTAVMTDQETGDERYVAQLREGKGRRAGDRSGGLGTVRDLDLTEWLATYAAALTPDTSDVPFAEDFDEEKNVTTAPASPAAPAGATTGPQEDAAHPPSAASSTPPSGHNPDDDIPT